LFDDTATRAEHMSAIRQMRRFAAVIVLAIAVCLSISAQSFAAPVVTSVTIDPGLTMLTVKGTGFGTSGAVLTFGSIGNMTITSQTDTLITATLPVGVASGSYLFSLSVGGKSNEFWFTIGTQGPIGPAGPQGPAGAGLSTGTITGTVVSCGTPLALALVYIPGRSFVANTGSTGTFTLDYVAPGTYSVVAESQSGAASNVTVAVSNGQTTNAGSIDVRDTNNDVNNCGACGKVCSVANGAPQCSGGTCQIKACNTGFADCDQNPANGCETNLSSVNNCGQCGKVCSTANATPSCTSGQCVIASCNAGFADCDQNPANGCETNLSNVNNCGQCGKVCSTANATPSCTSGQCVIASCNAGFADCDQNPANGCETNLSSVNNCGQCGNVCSANNGTSTCSAGVCAIACNPGGVIAMEISVTDAKPTSSRA
jgi:hypothetical protein